LKNKKLSPEQVNARLLKWLGTKNILDFFYSRNDIDAIVDDFDSRIMQLTKNTWCESEVLTWFRTCIKIGDEVGSKLGDSARKEIKEQQKARRKRDPMMVDYL
jgi:hypothetical protein